MVDNIGNTPQVSADTSFKTSDDYNAKQEALSGQIRDPQNVSDLKRNAEIKKQQIALARSYGDTELANVLTSELKGIEADIKRNESIFN